MRLDRELAPLRREEQKALSATEVIQLRKERRRRIVGSLIALVTVLIVGWVLLFYGPWIADETVDLMDETREEAIEQGNDPLTQSRMTMPLMMRRVALPLRKRPSPSPRVICPPRPHRRPRHP